MKKKISTKTILTSLAVLGLSALVYFWYQGSCWKDHSKALYELGDPIAKDVMAFYKENRRYPNLNESKVILKKAGCENIRQIKYKESKNLKDEVYEIWASYDCDYKYRTYSYGVSVGDLSIKKNTEAYEFGFSKGSNRCFGNFNIDGSQLGDFACFHDSCINLSH